MRRSKYESSYQLGGGMAIRAKPGGDACLCNMVDVNFLEKRIRISILATFRMSARVFV